MPIERQGVTSGHRLLHRHTLTQGAVVKESLHCRRLPSITLVTYVEHLSIIKIERPVAVDLRLLSIDEIVGRTRGLIV